MACSFNSTRGYVSAVGNHAIVVDRHSMNHFFDSYFSDHDNRSLAVGITGVNLDSGFIAVRVRQVYVATLRRSGFLVPSILER